jgi:hypothetical protein
MTANEIKLLRPLVESICAMSDGLSKPFFDAAMDGLETVFESIEDKAASTWAAASKATADIWNIDKSIGLVNTSAEALKSAQQHKVQATQSSPMSTDDEKSNAEREAAEKTIQIQQSTDAKVAELTEKKRAIETNLAAKQAENA